MNKEFLTACFYGHYTQCMQFLQKGADVNYKLGFVTPLFWAINGSPQPYVEKQTLYNRIQTIKLLLDSGCHITNADALLKTSLTNYYYRSQYDFMKHIVKLLLPKIKNWQTYNFTDWKEGRELCITEQKYLLTVQQVLDNTPLPVDIQRYIIEFCG